MPLLPGLLLHPTTWPQMAPNATPKCHDSSCKQFTVTKLCHRIQFAPTWRQKSPDWHNYQKGETHILKNRTEHPCTELNAYLAFSACLSTRSARNQGDWYDAVYAKARDSKFHLRVKSAICAARALGTQLLPFRRGSVPCACQVDICMTHKHKYRNININIVFNINMNINIYIYMYNINR